MKYLSVCSGIEAASVAWHGLGWEPVGFSEIEKFPSQVLATRFPGVKNYGDMTRFKEWDIERRAIDVLVGGTPCQAFSVAGLRKGLSDPRGNLALTFVAMVDHYRPEWVVWENVPGVLSSSGGRDFGSFLGALGQLGYGFAYRVLDAQFFGVAQRRRRVFVVAHSSGDARRAAEVLFEPSCLRGDPPPRREAREGIAGDATQGAGGRLWDTVGTLCADTHPGAYSGQDAYTGRLIPAVSYGTEQQTLDQETCGTLTAGFGKLGAPEVDAYTAIPVAMTPEQATDRQTFTASIGDFKEDEVAKTILRNTGAGGETQNPAWVIEPAVYESRPNDSRVTGPVEQSPTVAAKWGTGGNNTPLVHDVYAENFNAIQSQNVAPSMTTSGYSPTQNAGGAFVVQQPMAFTHSGYSNQPAWITGDRTDCLSAGGHSDTSHQGIGIIEPMQQAFRKSRRAQSTDDFETWVDDGVANTVNCFDQGDIRTTHAVAVQQPTAFAQNQLGEVRTHEDVMGTININANASGRNTPMVMVDAAQDPMAFSWQSGGDTRGSMPRPTAQLQRCQIEAVLTPMAVRRLTPVECERLQGFPDGWTDIKPGGKDTPDSPRYKALGNSMAVPVMRWIGERIEAHK